MDLGHHFTDHQSQVSLIVVRYHHFFYQRFYQVDQRSRSLINHHIQINLREARLHYLMKQINQFQSGVQQMDQY